MLVNHLIRNSPTLTELLVTREWLQDNAPDPQFIESATAYRNFTRHNILHQQRLAAAGRDSNLVKELDPDATVRNQGTSLAAEDHVCAYPIYHLFTSLISLLRPTKKHSLTHYIPTFVPDKASRL